MYDIKIRVDDGSMEYKAEHYEITILNDSFIQIEIQIDDSKDLTYVFSKSEFKGIITHHVQEPTKTNETR